MTKDEIKKLIEEEAERYADSKGIYNQHGEALLKMGFKKGANFILSKWQEAEMWRKVSEKLPDPDIAVLCRMKSPNVIVEGFIYKHMIYYIIYI